MGSSLAIDGYYFIDLHSRALSAKKQTRKLDYEKEWALTAVPAADRKTDSLFFIVDNTGTVLVKYDRRPPSQYPHNPLANGWTKIESVEHLEDFHKTLARTN